MAELLQFGTDGIRASTSNENLAYTAHTLSCALGYLSYTRGKSKRILIARDTRIGGGALQATCASGVTAYGASAVCTGILPTPAAAALTAQLNCDYGIMISASHNAPDCNGVKVFSGEGSKLTPNEEQRLFALMQELPPPNPGGKRLTVRGGAGKYAEKLSALLPPTLPSSLVLDLANGAVNKTAPLLFDTKHGGVGFAGTSTEGKRVNVGCGSTNPHFLQRAMRLRGAELGFAFDGDGDRIIAADRWGLYDGDRLLYILACRLSAEGRLAKNTVVGTVMTNMGLAMALKKRGISLLRTDVGDKFISEKMRTLGLNLGGEESGHIILRDYSETGDGLLTACLLLRLLYQTKKSLSALAEGYCALPTCALSHKADDARKQELLRHPTVLRALKNAEQRLGSEGRILLRPSGTEPKLRIMAEATDAALCRSAAEAVLQAIQQADGLL
ncbi:MAG: phosphoglucosamine mutase [Clostridia bacterium]|nr:phosphoglucosamine mutase [Clostridia bacterium]